MLSCTCHQRDFAGLSRALHEAPEGSSLPCWREVPVPPWEEEPGHRPTVAAPIRLREAEERAAAHLHGGTPAQLVRSIPPGRGRLPQVPGLCPPGRTRVGSPSTEAGGLRRAGAPSDLSGLLARRWEPLSVPGFSQGQGQLLNQPGVKRAGPPTSPQKMETNEGKKTGWQEVRWL